MILEGLVTTRGTDGRPHLAPMGPHVDGADFTQFTIRPFPTSTTCQNLLRHPEGVLHVTDDALLIARAAIGQVTAAPDVRPALAIEGFVLPECHRYFEFRVQTVDSSGERVTMVAAVIAHGTGTRPWFGFNRARHAVIEAAILATRLHILPREQIEREFAALATVVHKTGAADEHEAMLLLNAHCQHHWKGN